MTLTLLPASAARIRNALSGCALSSLGRPKRGEADHAGRSGKRLPVSASTVRTSRLIRMGDEIRLCRVHLEIMSHRKGLEYRMTTEGVDLEAQTPPAVIHTLVENAITHNHYTEGQVEFRLRQDLWEGRRRYLFESPLGPTGSHGRSGEGTGLRYIRARLQESFGSDWTLRSERRGEHWQTEIVLPAGA